MQTTRPRYDSPFFSLNARTLLAHRAGTSLAGIGLVDLGLGNTLGQDLGILVLERILSAGLRRKCESVLTYGLVLDLLGLSSLESSTVTLVLQTLGGDKSLNARSLGVRGLTLTLGLNLSSNNVLADLVS